MFLKSFKSQFCFALRQRISLIVFGILLLIVSINFVDNVLTFQGSDVTNMYHPMKILALSYNKVYFDSGTVELIVQLYPLLVACPAGLIYAKENQMGMNILMEARTGGFNYKFGKLLAVFCVTALVFTIPFLIEILLNLISFPCGATGDLSNLDIYDAEYIQCVKNYAYAGLYNASPVIYAIISTIIFGLLSGILGMTACAFSMIVPVKYRVMYLLPTFILLNSTVYFWPEFFNFDYKVAWYHYYLVFNDETKNMPLFFAVQSGLVCLTLIGTFISSRKDCITNET